MLLFNISNYADFNHLFGLESHANGAKSRKNKILLQHIKNRSLIRYCREHSDWSLLHIRNMADLKTLVLAGIRESGISDKDLSCQVKLIGSTYRSARYRTDHMEGLCEDFDKKSVRYVNTKTERVYKMKAGKFFTAIIKETGLGRILSGQVVNWLAEEFTQDWQTFTHGRTSEVELHVDDNFELIYDPEACKDFNGCSCMVGRNRHRFYTDSVNAKAAYLLDKEGHVLSRAVIFTHVKDEKGKKWRLCERQYARGSDEVLKRLLVDMLIRGGHIDGYKQVGAGCHDSRAFVANDGTSLADKKFSIRCELHTDQTLSYQDSFKYYDYAGNTAYNHEDASFDYSLDTTDLNLDGDDDDEEEYEEYDDWHGYSCHETRLCYVRGHEYNVDADNLEEFVYVESCEEYHHKDDCTRCPTCGTWVLKEDATYNEDADGSFCNEECESSYIEEHFHYAEYDDEYFPEERDIARFNVWDEDSRKYREMTISAEMLNHLIQTSQVSGEGDSWFLRPSAQQSA